LQRLEALFAKSAGTAPRVDPQDPFHEHMAVRRRSVEAVYAHDWSKVEMTLVAGCRRPRVEPLHWTELVEPEDIPVKRWYSAERVAGGRKQLRPSAV
jgi:hypothetical protein